MVVPVLDDGSEASCQLAERLDLPLEKSPESYYLVFVENQWVVRDPRQGAQFSIQLDFNKELEKLTRQRLSVKRDLLCRAVGFQGQEDYTVIDGTLGAGKDSLLLYHFGVSILGIEQHSITHCLVESALAKSELDTKKFQIKKAETCDFLQQGQWQAQVLYLDPMFENTSQKSAPKKTLAFIRELETPPMDVEKIILKAFEVGIKRVVVKRPLKAAQLYGKPSSVLRGKLIRYDVYTR